MARTSKLASLAALLRIHHWVKNLLVLVPLVTSHEIDSLSLIGLGSDRIPRFLAGGLRKLRDQRSTRYQGRPAASDQALTAVGYGGDRHVNWVRPEYAAGAYKRVGRLVDAAATIRGYAIGLCGCIRHLFPLHSTNPLPIESRIISRHSKQREDCFQKAVIKRGLRRMRRSALRARSFSSP